MAKHLQERHHLPVNGIALISMVLDMGTIRFQPGNDRPYPAFLPTYAALGHFHGVAGEGTSLEDHVAAAAGVRARRVHARRWPPGPGSTPSSAPASSPGSRS